MAKKLFAVMLGFALAPAFTIAEHTERNIVGTDCLVRVYHTQFAFPPEGGRIVQIGNELFFWKNYRADCQNYLPHNQPVLVTSHPGTGVTGPTENTSRSLNGSLGNQIAGDPCAVRVYHTNFAFPPEGGKIVQIGNEMYFIKSYRPECAYAGANGTVLVSSPNGYNPAQNTQSAYVIPASNPQPVNPYAYTTPYSQPVYNNPATCY